MRISGGPETGNALDAHHVTMFFASHIHAYYTGTWGNTPYTITGGGGGELETDDPEHDFFNYVMITVGPDGVIFTVVKLETPSMYALDLALYKAWIDVFTFVTEAYVPALMGAAFIFTAHGLLVSARGSEVRSMARSVGSKAYRFFLNSTSK